MSNQARLLRTILLFSIAANTVSAQTSQRADAVQVEAIRVQLFHERSGTLSEDLVAAGTEPFNVIIGSDPSESFLVSVVLRGQPPKFDQSGFVNIAVYDDKKGTKLAERRIRGGLLFGDQGLLIKPFMVYDRNCTAVRITAATRAGAKTVRVPFRCGE
jgi:hypothetical protein